MLALDEALVLQVAPVMLYLRVQSVMRLMLISAAIAVLVLPAVRLRLSLLNN